MPALGSRGKGGQVGGRGGAQVEGGRSDKRAGWSVVGSCGPTADIEHVPIGEDTQQLSALSNLQRTRGLPSNYSVLDVERGIRGQVVGGSLERLMRLQGWRGCPSEIPAGRKVRENKKTDASRKKPAESENTRLRGGCLPLARRGWNKVSISPRPGRRRGRGRRVVSGLDRSI